MQTHNSIESMVRTYAQQAVALAAEFNSTLDFSETSIREVEGILAQLAREMPAQQPSLEDVGELCKIWGCYLGEVVRLRFGGEWNIETYPGKEFATLTLNVGGSKLFPSIKVHRRLTEGESDNLWTFYGMVKTRLESTPGGKVQ
jgi:hypothetical protein